MRNVIALAVLVAGLAGTDAHARYFSPMTGNFLSPDRAGMLDGPNAYAYAHSNPVMYTDPTGLYATFGSKLDLPAGYEGWLPVPTTHADTGQSLRLREVAESAFDAAEGWLMRPGVAEILRRECSIDPGGARVRLALSSMEVGAARPSQLFYFDLATSRRIGAAGQSADLGQRPFKIAFGPTFTFRDPLYPGGPERVPLQELSVTYVHELLHHYLQYDHAENFTPGSDPVYRAAKAIAKSAGYSPWE